MMPSLDRPFRINGKKRKPLPSSQKWRKYEENSPHHHLSMTTCTMKLPQFEIIQFLNAFLCKNGRQRVKIYFTPTAVHDSFRSFYRKFIRRKRKKSRFFFVVKNISWHHSTSKENVVFQNEFILHSAVYFRNLEMEHTQKWNLHEVYCT